MDNTEKILVAGASGMVGSAIIRKLFSMGYTNLVGSYHSTKPDAKSFLKSADDGMLNNLRLVQMDLTNQADVNQLFQKERPGFIMNRFI